MMLYKQYVWLSLKTQYALLSRDCNEFRYEALFLRHRSPSSRMESLQHTTMSLALSLAREVLGQM